MRRREYALILVLFSVAPWAEAQSPVGIQGIPTARLAEKPRATTKSPQQAFLDGERRVAFPKGATHWTDVIEWFSAEAGLPFIGSGVPAGSFRQAGPQDAAYTGAEAVDAINDGLATIEHMLVRREGAFTVLRMDALDPSYFPLVATGDLDNYGKTEIVRVVVPLRLMQASDVVPRVKPGLGQWGAVAALTEENQFVATAPVGKLRRLLRAIQLIEKEEGNSFAHKFIYLRARDAEPTVRRLLDQLPAVGRTPEFDLPLPAAKVRSDERTNTVFISAPRVVIAQVVADVKKIDQPQPPTERPFIGPELRNIDVPAGSAELLIRVLTHLPPFRATSTFRMVAVSPDRIVVYAVPELRAQLDTALAIGLALPPAMSEGLSVSLGQGMAIVDQLHGFVGDSKTPRRILKTAATSR